MKSRWGWKTGVSLAATAMTVVALTAPYGSSSAEGGGRSASGLSGSATSVPVDDVLAPQPLAERTRVQVGISSRVANFLPLFLADVLGEFDRENIDIEYVIQPATETIVLVANGDLDASMATVNAGVFNLLAAGTELKFVYPTSERAAESRSGIWVRNDLLGDDGFQPSDLVGATIASNSGEAGLSSAYAMLQLLSEDPEIALGDVTWEQLSTPDGAQALMNGAVDGSQLSSPFWQLAEESGCCEYIDYFPQWPSAYVAFGSTMLENDELAMAFLRPMARVVREHLQGEYWTDPDLATSLIEVLEIPADSLANAVSDAQFDPDFGFDPDAAVAVQDYYFALGETLSYEEPLPADALFDLQYVEALRGGG